MYRVLNPSVLVSTSLLLFNVLGCNADASSKLHALESRAVGDVEWHQCPDITDPLVECGTFVVPLDHSNPSSGTATLSISKYRAQTSPKKGTVFLGAGGPGDLGQSLPILLGEFFSSARIGTDYDIIGFDHRAYRDGIYDSYCPMFYIGGRNVFYRNTVFELGYTQPPNIGQDPFARFDLILQYRQAISMFETQAKRCTLNMPNGGADLKYMGTSTVARDIEYMSRVITGADTPINYYGGSYGSILGMYLVNMFPNRVGRVAIDGIADPVSWSGKHSHEWIDGWLNQTEANYDWFLKACIQAGPTKCALATGKNTVEGLKGEIEAFFNKLYSRPLASPNSTLPAYLTSALPDRVFSWACCVPERGPLSLKASKRQWKATQAPLMNDFLLPELTLKGPDTKMSRYSLTRAINRIRKVSPHFGISATLSEPDGGCEFWPAEGVERFTGPWNHTLTFPVLIASTLVDPITPLASAKLVNRPLGNSSRLLIQRNPGHVTLSGVSTCTTKVFLAYFGNGTLPENETLCETDTQPFGLSSSANLTTEEMALSKRMDDSYERLSHLGRLF